MNHLQKTKLYYLAVLKKYTVFSGRASRAEYWYFVLGNFIIGFILGFAEGMLGVENAGEGILINLYQLAILLPWIGLAIRRAHDVNKSGWWMIVPLYNLYLALKKGDAGDNEYGPAPTELDATKMDAMSGPDTMSNQPEEPKL